MEGLEKIQEAFAEFSDNYVIIGGTACEITMTGTAVRPRATHDIDMIVVVEKMTPEFGTRFWRFVQEAGYRPEKRKTTEGEPVKYELYRFVDGKVEYPEMIEILSRHPDVLGEPKGFVIEPIPIDEGISSLSSIIMDDDLYYFTLEHSSIDRGVRHADSASLVALKARAYLNLMQDKAAGRHVNSKDIRKHRSDVLKSVAIMENEEISAPDSIVECVHEFVSSIRKDWQEIGSALAASLDQSVDFTGSLLDILDKLFVKK